MQIDRLGQAVKPLSKIGFKQIDLIKRFAFCRIMPAANPACACTLQ
jgi:hypothetical protein